MQINSNTANQLRPPPDRGPSLSSNRSNIVNTLCSRPVALACLALLALLAALPAPFRGRFATSGLVHASAHIAVFYVAFLVTVPRSRNGRHTAILGCLLLSYGAALELLQTFLFHIPLEYADVLADAAGVALGILSRSIAKGYGANRG
jgi:hypothetical protein